MPIKHLKPRNKTELKVAKARDLKEKEESIRSISKAFQKYMNGEYSMNQAINSLNLSGIHVSIVRRSAGSEGYDISANIGGDTVKITVTPDAIIKEGIKHLGPKSEKELRDSVKGLSYPDKLEFAKENNLDWLKKEAEEELKKNYKDLPMDIKFRYASDYKIDWLKKAGEEDFKKGNYPLEIMFRYAEEYAIEWLKEEAEKKFKKEAYISPIFKSIHEKLQEVIGQNFDYEIDYHYKNNYDLKFMIKANGVHFLIQESTRNSKTSPPEIKYAKKLDETFFFTDGVYLANTKQMMAYIKRKIKESKE